MDNGAIAGFAGIADTTTWNFTTESAPAIAALNPLDGATNVPTTANLVITFDKAAYKGTGNIVIKDSGDNVFETIDVTSGQVTVSNAVVTINPAGVLALNTGYYVQMDAGAIAGFAGIADTTTWDFTTTAEPPAIVALSPADGATSASIDDNLVITFDREVGKGTGNIVIKKSSDNTDFETIAVTSGQVTVSNAVVTINPTGTFDYATGYYVQMDNGAMAGFAGIADTTTWNFTTLPAGYRRWDGSASTTYTDSNNWTVADVPDTPSEAANIHGDNAGRTEIQWAAYSYTIGQLRIGSPATTRRLYGVYDAAGTRYLTLIPTNFGGIGLDMSEATVDFGVTSWNSTRRMIPRLGSDQQWNVTSTSPSGGNLNLLYSQQDPYYQEVDLQGFTLTANVGSGRTIDATMGAFIGAGGTLIKTGAGTILLGRPNTYSGTTRVEAGTLTVNGDINASTNIVVNGGALNTGGANKLADTAAVTVAGGTLSLGGNDTVGAVVLSGGSITGAVGVVLTGTAYDARSGSASVSLAGAGSALDKTTAGTVILAGSNTYSGATTISAGTLQLGDGGAAGALSPSSTLTDNATLAFNRSGAITQGTHFASAISGSGNVVKLGGGTLVLSGTNTYSGTTTVSNGILQLTQPQALATNSSVALVTGGALDLAFSGTNQVAALSTNTVPLANGVYDSSSLPVLVTGSGCLQVGAGLTASFTGGPATGFAPLTVNFTNNSVTGGGAITNCAWDFGDATTTNTPTVVNLAHSYTSTGTFTVILAVSDDAGQSQAVTNNSMVTVAAVPTPVLAGAGAYRLNPASGYATFTFTGTNGVKYRILYNDDLLNTNGWTAVMPPEPDGWTNGANAAITLQDTNAPAATQRFYRVEAKSADAP